MPTVHQLMLSEITEVEATLDTSPAKVKRVLGLYKAELIREYDGEPASLELFERIRLYRLMSQRLICEVIGECGPLTSEDDHLIELLFSTGKQFSDATRDPESCLVRWTIPGTWPNQFRPSLQSIKMKPAAMHWKFVRCAAMPANTKKRYCVTQRPLV
jgi:hypothetical protein